VIVRVMIQNYQKYLYCNLLNIFCFINIFQKCFLQLLGYTQPQGSQNCSNTVIGQVGLCMQNFIKSRVRLWISMNPPQTNRLVMGLGQKVLTRVNFLMLNLVRVSHLWVWKISPKNPNFSFFPLHIVLVPGQNFLTGSGQVNFLWLGLGQTSMVWVWKIFPKNVKLFNILLFRSKKYHWVVS